MIETKRFILLAIAAMFSAFAVSGCQSHNAELNLNNDNILLPNQIPEEQGVIGKDDSIPEEAIIHDENENVPEGRIGNEITGYITLPHKWEGVEEKDWKFKIPNTAAGTYAVKPTTLTHIDELDDDVPMKAMSVELALYNAQDFAAALSLMHEENPQDYVNPSIVPFNFKNIDGWQLKYSLPSGAIEVSNIVIPSPVDDNACFVLTTYAPKNGSDELFSAISSWSFDANLS